MKKLSLDLDSLRVDSFQTAHEQDATRGTVRGHLVAQSYFNNCNFTWYCQDTNLKGGCTFTCPDTGLEQCGETANTCM